MVIKLVEITNYFMTDFRSINLPHCGKNINILYSLYVTKVIITKRKDKNNFSSDYFVVKLTADHERLPSHIYNEVTNHHLRAYVRTTKHRDHFRNRMLRAKRAANIIIFHTLAMNP